jgi:3-hydroxymyristoyl/3-hydroxydecanoyl-(acyl carrier protein) dehydratase
LAIQKGSGTPGALNARVSIPDSHPAFAGHFPGAPVLPGVVQIGLVLDALREVGPPLVVVRIPFVRFRSAVGPGDVLDMRMTPPGPDGRVGFEISRNGGVVSHGTLVLEVAGD